MPEMFELPPDYMQQMKSCLNDEFDLFADSYRQPRAHGLRFNPLKVAAAAGPLAATDTLAGSHTPGGTHRLVASTHPPATTNPVGTRMPVATHPLVAEMTALFGLSPVPWCDEGRYYDPATRPGRHPYHAAGLYYIQEPSAMIAVELLDPQPGELILDLAAAPGGKSTQIAGRLNGQGLLVANEIHPARAKILSENIERLGITNAIVTQADPQQLSARFDAVFDRILLDAPCSGEGMFRKEPDAVREWSMANVEACAARQRSILPHAAAMLKPGGVLVYSTCTFNEVENEQTIAAFLAQNPAFRLLKEERVWPHRAFGEGHYAAVLVKEGEAGDGQVPLPLGRGLAAAERKGRHGARSEEKAALDAFAAFAEDAIPGFRLPAGGTPLLFGDALYWLPQPPGSPLTPQSLQGLRTPRPGLHLGDRRKGRFEPAHALAVALRRDMAALSSDYAAASPEVSAYLRGDTLPAPTAAKGWGIVAVDGFPLGWFKASDGQLKNRLPKGLRFTGG